MRVKCSKRHMKPPGDRLFSWLLLSQQLKSVGPCSTNATVPWPETGGSPDLLAPVLTAASGVKLTLCLPSQTGKLRLAGAAVHPRSCC